MYRSNTGWTGSNLSIWDPIRGSTGRDSHHLAGAPRMGITYWPPPTASC